MTNEDIMQTFKVGVVQATPFLFDAERTLAKTGELTRQAAAQGCELIIFPESFIPGYPRGLSFDTAIGWHDDAERALWQTYWENSVLVPSEQTKQLSAFAREAKSYLVIGITERDAVNGSLYCSVLYFDKNGELIGKHRKLKPTGTERLVWGEGDGSDLQVFDTELGRLGGLICWENYMPLARMALYEQGIQIYIAPTADARDTWQATTQHIACEGRCFVIGCNQFVTKNDYPENLQSEIAEEPEVLCRGGSVVVSPLGEVLAGPVYGKEDILVADLDLKEVIKGKFDFDPIGHYARKDVFAFDWKKSEKP